MVNKDYHNFERCFHYVGMNTTIRFVLLGLVFMGRRKCEAVACLSSQMKCYFYELLYGVLYGE